MIQRECLKCNDKDKCDSESCTESDRRQDDCCRIICLVEELKKIVKNILCIVCENKTNILKIIDMLTSIQSQIQNCCNQLSDEHVQQTQQFADNLDTISTQIANCCNTLSANDVTELNMLQAMNTTITDIRSCVDPLCSAIPPSGPISTVKSNVENYVGNASVPITTLGSTPATLYELLVYIAGKQSGNPNW